MLDEFKQPLSKAMARYKQQGVQAGDVLVHLWAEEKVACGRFDKLIADCRENQIERYVLKIDWDYLDPSRPAGREKPPPIDVKFSLLPKHIIITERPYFHYGRRELDVEPI